MQVVFIDIVPNLKLPQIFRLMFSRIKVFVLAVKKFHIYLPSILKNY